MSGARSRRNSIISVHSNRSGRSMQIIPEDEQIQQIENLVNSFDAFEEAETQLHGTDTDYKMSDDSKKKNSISSTVPDEEIVATSP